MKKILALLSLLLLVSCSVQKRKYQKGFYVNRVHPKAKSTVDTHKSAKNYKIAPATDVKTSIPLRSGDALISANLQGEVENFPAKKNTSLSQTYEQTDSCDVLIFRDGSEISAKIIEVGITAVTYKRCDNPEGPTYSTFKRDLFMIKYANGSREVIKESAPVVKQNNNIQNYNLGSKPRVMDPEAIISFLLSVASVVIGFIPFEFPEIALLLIFAIALVAFIFAIRSMRRVKRNPELYKGRGLARASLIISAIILGIYVIVLLFFILLLLLI